MNRLILFALMCVVTMAQAQTEKGKLVTTLLSVNRSTTRLVLWLVLELIGRRQVGLRYHQACSILWSVTVRISCQ